MAQNPLEGPKLLVSDAISDADTNTTAVVLEIPAGTWIPPYGVTIYIPEVFAGGTPSLDVGDEDDPDGWVDSTEITETTIGTYSGIAAAFAVTGKFYATVNHIEVVVSASLTGGTAYVVAQTYNLSNRSMVAV